MSWDNGVQWGAALGQYAIFAELAVMAGLWMIGALIEGLTHGRKRLERGVDEDA